MVLHHLSLSLSLLQQYEMKGFQIRRLVFLSIVLISISHGGEISHIKEKNLQFIHAVYQIASVSLRNLDIVFWLHSDRTTLAVLQTLTCVLNRTTVIV